VAKLTTEQAVYHFLSGYTAKVAGTELGIKEPQATFSACFGAPFMALPPTVYARLLKEKIEKHQVACWLVNTGWSGRPYGEGDRIKIAHSRAIIKSILNDQLRQVEYVSDPLFKFQVPKTCAGVPPEILDPRSGAPNKAQYEERAKQLLADFQKNFKQFEGDAAKEIGAAIL
jgi:phosphoenolpyruvate carboxykinase (ATP)